ncbi:TRAP-type mannitol/chloroaromatic compound transport system, small permease component [Loktanella sp. DSM 29012]|uniref:TRAP transporter small permease subunit n=1 Tax=Loktanella sp. DSM 29012 TaxID=1881056 RepID=UPI0008C0860B|nr:TRAP transporter small permease subunit [Loktanella sp. DSM 29012]SEQ72611.1 TRAP-type mannitol/chloroaromatic compound transport system, small permease component [Loktanella sp. DSM 29012]
MEKESASRALVARGFGWLVLAVTAGYMVNVVLNFWFDFPGVTAGLENPLSLVQVAVFAVLAAVAVLYVLRSPDVSLRADAARISDFNRFLVRAAFWVVLLVGIGDSILSFLRVQGFLDGIVGDDLASNLARADFRGVYLHVPLIILGIVIGAVTRGLGFTWLTLMVVIAELAIVFSRFVFSYEQAFLSDLVRFWYGALFLFASAYTLLEDGHVRVDLFYASMRRETKGRVNSVGAVIMGMTLCWTILIVGFGTASSVIVGPILVFEVTQAGFGLYVKYFMAGFLAVFAITMMVQFVAQFMDSIADKRGEPGGRDAHAGTM